MDQSAAEKVVWTDEEKDKLLCFDKNWKKICPQLKQTKPNRRPRGFFKCAAEFVGDKKAENCKPTLQKLLLKPKAPSKKISKKKDNFHTQWLKSSPQLNNDDDDSCDQNCNLVSLNTNYTTEIKGPFVIEENSSSQTYDDRKKDLFFRMEDHNNKDFQKNEQKAAPMSSVVLDSDMGLISLNENKVINETGIQKNHPISKFPTSEEQIQGDNFFYFIDQVEASFFKFRETDAKNFFKASQIKVVKLKLNNITEYTAFINQHWFGDAENSTIIPDTPKAK